MPRVHAFTDDALGTHDAVGLVEALHRGEVSAPEVVEAAVARTEAVDPALGAVAWRAYDRARAEARALRGGYFAGVPGFVKDNVDVEGLPTLQGTDAYVGRPAPRDGDFARMYHATGLVTLGKTRLSEYGFNAAVEHPRLGPVRNPWAPERTAGASSAGAAALVAAGAVPIAHANDGGGSIRIPASCCGLVGLKVSRGRVPALAQAWEGAAVEGVVSHTVADTAAVLDAISQADPLGWWNAPAPARPFADEVGADPGSLRIAVLTETALGLPTAPACEEAVQGAVAALEAAGHRVVDVVPDFAIEAFIANFVTVVNSGLAAYDDRVDWSKVEEHNRLSREAAGTIDCISYAKAVIALQAWTRTVNAQWGDGFDVLVTPTMAIEPAPAGQILREVQADPGGISPTVLHSVLFTAVFNMNGLPAISLPLHQSADSGLPIGVQLVAGPWQESTLIQLSAQLEQAMPWNDRHPSLQA